MDALNGRGRGRAGFAQQALLVLVFAVASSGCSALGYYRLDKAEDVPPGERDTVALPESMEGAIELKGPVVAALEKAMGDFLPPGKKVRWKDGYAPLEECLSRRDTYDALVLPYGDGRFYVSFSPVIERCGLSTALLDGGAEYVVDERGRLLRVR